MVVENVAELLTGGTVIDPMTQPISHGMKLCAFILDVGNPFSLLLDLPNHLYGGTTKLRTLDRPGSRASLRATIGIEPTIFDKRVRYESIIAHYEEMPQERVEEMDVDVVVRAFLFYLLSTALFTNHGNYADWHCCHPYKGLDVTRQHRYELVSTRSFLCRPCLALMLPLMRRLFPEAGLGVQQEAVVGYLHRRLLLPELFYDMYYYHRERVYEWDLSSKKRRVPHDVPYCMLSTRSIKLEQDIATALEPRWRATIWLLLCLAHMPYLCRPSCRFMSLHWLSLTLLLSNIRRGSDSEAPDTTIIISKLEHGPGASFSFISERIGWTAQGMLETHLVSPYRMTPPRATPMCLVLTIMRCVSYMKQRASSWLRRGSQTSTYLSVIVEEIEESGSDDSEETASYAS
ncbi:hypothetical protein JCGZ_16219 [Jatropha curcas]|uniref:Aminotransferase-like plant mobile domain-containing protein n=1 Tax=Jatropha curcas TaxID=180498 RepID=A0A067K6K9_JATCU|nr:hypothetical protein JCGZ_16219 [Jatropha curcas]